MRCTICTELYGKSDRATEECDICEDTSASIKNLIEIMLEASRDYEFSTFSLGTKIYDEIEEREKKINAEGRFKREINEMLRINFESASGKEYLLDNGELYFLVDARFDWVKVASRSVFIYGRYNKFSREIPQTKKICSKCSGRGCYYCNGDGKLYQESVEEIIGNVFIKHFKATSTKFHGMGREDIDVRMLGEGRPFVIELVEPKIRSADLKALENEVNESKKIKISKLAYSDFEEVVRIKSAKANKVYVADVSFDRDVTMEELQSALLSLRNREIHQRTPLRVLARRSDLVRIKMVNKAEVLEFSERRTKIEMEAESGTYIKELIHGDKGRTTPSLSSLLKCECRVEALDVIEIEKKEE